MQAFIFMLALSLAVIVGSAVGALVLYAFSKAGLRLTSLGAGMFSAGMGWGFGLLFVSSFLPYPFS